MSNENDDEPDLPCGCRSEYEHHEFAYWIMCPVHEGAEDLLAACKAVLAELDEQNAEEGMALTLSEKAEWLTPGFRAMVAAVKKCEGSK